MTRKRARVLFCTALAGGTVAIVTGGLMVVGSLAPTSVGIALGEHARTIGTVLLQIGIVLELIAVALHERLSFKELRRGLSGLTTRITTLKATVMPGGRH